MHLNKQNLFLFSYFLICFNLSLNAQNFAKTFVGKTLTKTQSVTVVDNFSEYTIVDFDLSSLNDFVHLKNSRNNNFTAQTVRFQMGQYDWTFELYQEDIFSEDFQLTTIENGKHVEVPINRNKTYMGYLRGTNDEVRLTIDDGFMSGVVYENGKAIYIEPLSRFEQHARSNQFIIYEGDKVLSPRLSCAHNDAEFKIRELEEGSARFLTNQCYEVRLGIATDATVFNSLTTVTAVNNFTTAVFNNIRPIYRFAFGDNIEFLIAQQYVSQATANDPFSPATSSIDAEILLNNFGTWMVGNGFGTTNLDLGSVWVSRNLSLKDQNGQLQPAEGVANFGLCTTLSNRTHVIKYTPSGNASGYACLVAHETGHNFHAGHVNGANIMNPSCSSSLVWDPSTVTTITNQLNSASCTSGANALTPCLTPVAAISGGVAACVGQPITIRDNSQFGATRSWATPSGSITSGTAVNHTVTYNTAGTYTVSLTSTNSNGSSTANATILVGNAPVSICVPTPNSGQGGGGISRFALANVDNTSASGTTLNEKLEDFACTDIITLEKSTMYTLKSLTLDFGPDFNNPIFQGWKVYIDYNNNGDFTDTGEEVINHGGQLAAGDILQNPNLPATAKSFTTPANPVENTILRLRVVVDDNNITPCMTPNEGQIEDYGVVFKAVVPCPAGLANTTASKIGITNSTCSTMGSFAAITCATGSTAQYSTNNGTSWSSTLPTYNAASAMTVLTRCNCNSDNSISSMTNTATTVPVIKPIVTKPSDQTVTAGNSTAAVTFSGTSGATYAWTNDNTGTGIPASGSGNMPVYSNMTAGVSNITVTPTLNGCTGTPQVFKITVNAASTCPTVGAFTGPSMICSGDQAPSLVATGLTNMASTYDLAFYHTTTKQTTAAGVYAITASVGGVANANLTSSKTVATLTNVFYPTTVGTHYIYARVYPTPTDANCRPFKEITVVVKEKPIVTKPSDQTVTTGSSTAAVTFSGTSGSTYAWTNDNTGTGIAASGSGNMPAYSNTNAGISNIIVTPTLNGCIGTPQTFKITVTAPSSANCMANVVINTATFKGDTAASNTIMTQNAVVINGPTVFSAPKVTLKPGFSVPIGQTFTATPTGCTSPMADGSCNVPFVLTCGQNYSGNNITNGANNWTDQNGNNGYTGKEVIHTLQIPAGVTVNLNLTGNTADVDLFVMAACTNNSASLIIQSSEIGDNVGESVTIPKDDFLTRTVYIIVDGWMGAATNYTLSCATSLANPIAANSRNSKTINSTDLANPMMLEVYPNPADQYVELKYNIKDENTPAEIGLYNLNGELVKVLLPQQVPTAGQHQTKIDIADLNSGMYFVILRQAGQMQTQKLVISQ